MRNKQVYGIFDCVICALNEYIGCNKSVISVNPVRLIVNKQVIQIKIVSLCRFQTGRRRWRGSTFLNRYQTDLFVGTWFGKSSKVFGNQTSVNEISDLIGQTF